MNRFPSFKTLTLIGGLLAISGFWLISLWNSSGPGQTPMQPDTLIYYQYAQAISDGHPYRFAPDQPLSTGSTSHLYPFVLAGLQLLGAQGEALASASFLLGVISLIVSLILLYQLEGTLFPESKGFGTFLAALSGPFLFTMLGESDIVLFAPLLLGFFNAVLQQRTRWMMILLVLLAWTRPEGMALAGAFTVFSFFAFLRDRQATWARRGFQVGLLGLIACAGVFLLNMYLTGNPVFSSVANKGHFSKIPFLSAGQLFAKDAVSILKYFIWGLGEGDRGFVFFPLLGAGLFILGLSIRSWSFHKNALIELTIWCTALLAFFLASTSGYAGFMFDRYFGWIVPLVLMYSAGGLAFLYQRVAWRNAAVILGLLLVIFQGLGLLYCAGRFTELNISMASQIQACREMQAIIPPGSRVSALGRVGLAYYLPGHSVINFFGITDTDFDQPRSHEQNIEMLRHQPLQRFDYWLMRDAHLQLSWLKPLLGKRIFAEMRGQQEGDALLLYEADWSIFDLGLHPVSTAAQDQVQGMQQVDCLDVGYADDEQSHDRELYSRMKGLHLYPFTATRSLDGQSLLDVGDVVLGLESFTVNTLPQKPLRVVMRTSAAGKALSNFPNGSTQERQYRMNDPLRIRVQADGQLVSDYALSLGSDTNAFSEVVFDVPASFIQQDKTRLTIAGDHISTAFWFYQ